MTTHQMTAAGLSPRAQRKRSSVGRLFRLHPGIYSLHPPPYSRHQRWLAAVLACGGDSLVAGWAAAALAGLREADPSLVEIVNPTGRGRGLAGVTAHRSEVDRRDRLVRHGIPCTSPARTIVDLARSASSEQLEELLLAADSVRLLNRRRLEELLAERRGQPGTRKLLDLITDDPAELRNVNERRMFSICREFGVPRPLTNFRVDAGGRTFYADFCWPELHLIVEADGWRWHGGRSANENDRDRDQLLSIAGWQVVHFTRDQIVRARRQTGNRLVALTRRSGLRPGHEPTRTQS